MDLSTFQAINEIRSKEVFGAHPKEQPLTFWAVGLAGEVGEACNVIKKYERGDDLPNFDTMLADELGDSLMHLCLLASHLGIDLMEVSIAKFNKVNDKYGRSDLNI